MKKIVSCTIATTLVASNMTALASPTVSALENKDDAVNYDISNELQNEVDVKIESTEKITEDTSVEKETKEEVKEELSQEVEIKQEEKKNESKEVKEVKEATGKLELDINFPMPIIKSESLGIGFKVSNSSKNIIDVKDIKLSGETLNNGISYKVQLLNSKKQAIQEGDKEIYFLNIIIENLNCGVYTAEIQAEGYLNTKIDNIDITDYSKRVMLSTGKSQLDKYNSVFLAGDVNKDGKIDMGDYELVFKNIGSSNSLYDLNKDGKIDIADLTYVNENIGRAAQRAEVVNTDAIIKVENVEINQDNLNIENNASITDLLVDSDNTVALSKKDGQAPSVEAPLVLDIDFSGALRNANNIQMEQIVLKAAENPSSEDAALPNRGSIVLTDANGNKHTVEITENNLSRSASGDIVIDLGKQVAVKQISINVTGNRGNKNISEIAKIEFLNNVYKEIPKPQMNIPQIKTVETSTNLHDERITITWEAQPNVTAYEVKYEKLDGKGNVTKTKKLQTNETKLNILDKDIKPYDIYRVSIQSLNGDWESGYELETGAEGTSGHKAFDGVADNVDKNYNPIKDYYDNDKGTVTEIQVVPKQVPQEPINIVTDQGYRSFTLSWEEHRQARDFDVYYRKVGSSTDKWLKANENNIEVTENSPEVTNPDKSKLIRGNSYTINGLEDRASYEIRVTATNHLGTSKMSKTYIASTEAVDPPVSSNYKLINKPTEEGEIGTTNILDVENHKDAKVTNKYAVVDNDYGTDWMLNDWDAGIYSDRGPIITFDKEYTLDTFTLVPTMQKGKYPIPYDMEIHGWDAEGKKITVHTQNISGTTSNGRQYATVKLQEPITVKKIQVNPSVYGGNLLSISELKFYEYDSLENDVKALYKDDLRLVLKDDVTQEKITELVNRANTKDPVSGEYHPKQSIILKELDTAQKLFNDKNISEEIVSLDPTLINDNMGPSLGMGNHWQSLGAVARPGKGENGADKKIVVYMGSNNPNAQVEITFLQQFGMPGAYQGGTTTIRPGRNEITIPKIISADVEKGGVVMARVKNVRATDEVKLRLSGVDEIPHLNVNNLINDASKEEEVKVLIRDYISELKTYVNELPNKYPKEASALDKVDNIYTYEETTAVLNSTDIEGDRFTLTVPATEVLKGIVQGIENDEAAQVNRVYDALLAWEQEVKIGFTKKGVYEEVQDFNGDGTIDNTDNEYFKKHKAPNERMNVKYQRMMMGAAAYASSHHVGVGFGEVKGFMQGVPYKFDENKNVINKDSARLYGTLIGHEFGHVMDIGDRLYPETSNNLYASITNTMLDQDNPQTAGAMNELYKKVTSNTIGLSTNRSVVLGMLWQPHLAYDNESTYKMLFNDNDGDMTNDSYYAKLNRAYREMTKEERANGDRDQWLIRMSSKVVQKDLSDFYRAHGIVPNATTLEYVKQFPKEERPIQYLNDEARRMRLEGKATMAADTKLTASFGADKSGNEIKDGSYVNQKEVPFKLSVDKDNDKILGYEIYRNNLPVGFVLRDKNSNETVYNDVIDNLNNRVFEYKVVAYDYNLNKTNEVELGTIKVRHDGGVAKDGMAIKTNTIDKDEANNDIHGSNPNAGLNDIKDNNLETVYEGRMLNKDEFNGNIHGQEMNPNNNPYVILELNDTRPIVGLKYTAPTTKGFFGRTKLSKTAINKYVIEVSKDGTNWTKVNEGSFNLDSSNQSETVYFNKEGVEGGKQLNAYNARYVKLTALGTKEMSIAELELIAPPGDNIEIGVAEDNINYKNGIGILKEKYVYVVDDKNTPDVNEEKSIPAGSIVITGEYRGNPAFNVPLVLNQNEEHIAEKYNGIIMAEIPNNGNLEEVSEGNWIYWVEPQDQANFMKDNLEIFAELYRTDSADASEGGQRLVSDTFKVAVPGELPEISLSGNSKKRNANVKAIEINRDLLNTLVNKR